MKFMSLDSLIVGFTHQMSIEENRINLLSVVCIVCCSVGGKDKIRTDPFWSPHNKNNLNENRNGKSQTKPVLIAVTNNVNYETQRALSGHRRKDAHTQLFIL